MACQWTAKTLATCASSCPCAYDRSASESGAPRNLSALIRSLVCRNFRGLVDITWPLEDGSHLLLGGTGQGKTSLLEAIYLATTTRSFRTSRLSDCARGASQEAAPSEEDKAVGGTIDAEAVRGSDEFQAQEVGRRNSGFYTCVEVESAARAKLELSWSPQEGIHRALNGDRSTLEEHLDQQPMLAWSRSDIDVLVGPPELRRRLVDRVSVAIDSRALTDLSRYRRALDHKRALLSQPSSGQRLALESFNEMLADSSQRLIARRARTIDSLREALHEVTSLFPRADFAIDLVYRSSPPLPDLESCSGGDGAPAEAFGEEQRSGESKAGIWTLPAFEHALANEMRTQRPRIGPHRDRIDVLFRGRPVAETASAGERKAIGLLLLAAQTRLLCDLSRPPVLLIDDVDTEMDQSTLEAVWPLLNEAPQTLFSSNREPVFSNLSVDSVWSVSNGSVEAR